MTLHRCLTAVSLFFFGISVASAGNLVVVAGGGDGADETFANKAKVVAPFGIDFGPDGKLYFVEMEGGERLRSIDQDGFIHTVAGTGKKGNSGDGGPGIKATFNGMHNLAVGGDGIVYLADTWNHRIRTFDPKTGIVAAFAGTGEKGFAGDGGSAEKAKFGDVYSLSFDNKYRHLYIADLDNRRIRAINMATKRVLSQVGNGDKGVPANNEIAFSAPLVDPRAVAVARDGYVFILERSGNALRMVNNTLGRIYTVAGTGVAGSDLNDGSALKAQFSGPKHLCIEYHEAAYSVLIADTENHRILRFTCDAKGTRLELVAGTGKKGSKIVDGDPLKSELAQPHGVAVHPRTGEIYIADSGNHRILKIER